MKKKKCFEGAEEDIAMEVMSARAAVLEAEKDELKARNVRKPL